MEDNTSPLPGQLLGQILSINIDTKLLGGAFANSYKSLETFPKTLADVNSFTTQYMSRIPVYEGKIGLLIATDLVYANFLKKSLPTTHEITVFIDGLCQICAKSALGEFEIWWCSEATSWLGRRLFTYITHLQSLKILEHLLSKLTNLKALQMTVDSEYIINICLKLFALAIEKLQESEITARFPDIHKPIFAYLPTAKLQLQAAWSIDALVKKCPSLILSLLSYMITYTTIAYAELEGLRTQYFSKETLTENINNLLGHCSCLAILIRALPKSNRGIPVEETEIAFNTVRNMVSGGEYQGDVIDEDKMFTAEINDQEIDNAIRHAAWILVDSLLYLGPSWVGSRLNFLFKLWKLPFGRKTCIIEQMPQYLIIGEVTHKKVASSAMLSFLKHNKSLLHPQIFKLITVYLTNALQFLCPSKNSTQHRSFLEQNCSSGGLTELKKNIYECILHLPSSFVSGKIALLLNPICSEVVNEKANSMNLYYFYQTQESCKPSAMMQLAMYWLNNEDAYLVCQKPLHYLNSLSLIGNEGQQENWNGNTDLSQSFSEMMSFALRISADVFTNSALNGSNRQKLFQYLSQHLSTSLKSRETNVKSNKICNVLLAVLGCLRNLSLNRGLITDQVLMSCIRSMLAGAESLSHPLIKCIFAEGMIYLCKVMGDPQHIPVFMKEIEHRIILSENNANIKSGIVMQVGNMYKHFEISMLERNQDALGHIIQSISRDPVAGTWALHALYKAYSAHDNKVENIFKATFPLGYHHYFNDYNSDFQFRDTMMFLSQKHLLLNMNPGDSFYLRSRIVWEDTWRKSEFAYECALKMLGNPMFNSEEIVKKAVESVPDKAAVVFLNKASLGAVNGLELVKVFEYFDKTLDQELEGELGKIIKKLVGTDPEAVQKLKNIILSIETIQEEEVKGLSALNDRESVQKPFDYFTEKSKLLALDLLIALISESPGDYQSQLEEYINFSIHLTSFAESISAKGFQLVSHLFKAYKDLIDTDDPSKKYLEIFEAQVSAAIREYIDGSSITLCKNANKLLQIFFIVPGSHDTMVIKRLVNTLVGFLATRGKFYIGKEGYTDLIATELYISRLLVLAKTLLFAPDFIADIVKE